MLFREENCSDRQTDNQDIDRFDKESEWYQMNGTQSLISVIFFVPILRVSSPYNEKPILKQNYFLGTKYENSYHSRLTVW